MATVARKNFLLTGRNLVSSKLRVADDLTAPVGLRGKETKGEKEKRITGMTL